MITRKEQIEKARELLACGALGQEACDAIKRDFPELQGTEDERIRKAIIGALNDTAIAAYGDTTIGEMLAYLEKQKEQKPIPALDRGDEIILKAICEELKDAPGWVERIEGWYSLAKDAQQPAERSDGDERIRKNICRIVKEHMRHCAEAGIETGDHREALQYLEKQKEQKPLSTEETELNSLAFLVQLGYTCIPPGAEPKPAEWTDADEKILKRIIERLRFVIFVPGEGLVGVTFKHSEDAEAINWLKRRVTSQPQPKQEWSEEDVNNIVERLKIAYNETKNEMFLEDIERIKSLRPQHNLRWRRATEGANLPESIIIPYGEEPRFGKCAVRDSYYIPISELKELTKE